MSTETAQGEQIDWDKIESFIGFGRRHAPVVFIGMEEGLRDPDGLLDDLRIRSSYGDAVMDLKVAHDGIAGTERYFEPEHAPRQPTWRVMADLMLRREGNGRPTGEQRREYRALRLGRSNGETLLTELLPYPHPKSSDWLYAPFKRHETREAYAEALLPERIRLLRSVLAEAPRELIVCYGKGAWTNYERLFDDVRWTDDGLFRHGQLGAMRIVLTTHFSGRDFNTDEQLQALADVALQPG